MTSTKSKTPVRRLRQQRGLTQQELANRTGLTRQAIVLIEQGKVKPRFATRFVIAAALGVEPSDLLGGGDD
jgi:transcriptional regulator with XRE-family HTH domain